MQRGLPSGACGLTTGDCADSSSAIPTMPEGGPLSSGLMETTSKELSRHGSWELSEYYTLGSTPHAAVFNAVTLSPAGGHQMWEALPALSNSLCMPMRGFYGRDEEGS